MKVLHLCSDFNYQKLYINLFKENSKRIDQIVYCGGRNNDLLGKNIDKSISNIEYYNPFNVYTFDKLNFFGKAKRQWRYINKNIKLLDISHSHAHTLFSDGILSYYLYKHYRIPYTISVRNTDVNVFFKCKPYLIPIARKICFYAKHLHFPSKTTKLKFNKTLKEYKEKQVLIPNPIDDFWIDNAVTTRKQFFKGDVFNICFVGKVDRNKNLDLLLDAFEDLNKHINLTLTVSGTIHLKSIKKRLLKNKSVNFIGYTSSKTNLSEIYNQSHLLCLPSKRETFGLVCIEAISQGIPFLMRKHEGVYGLLDVPDAMYFENDDDLKNRILYILNNYNEINDINFDLSNYKLSEISKRHIYNYN